MTPTFLLSNRPSVYIALDERHGYDYRPPYLQWSELLVKRLPLFFDDLTTSPYLNMVDV